MYFYIKQAYTHTHTHIYKDYLKKLRFNYLLIDQVKTNLLAYEILQDRNFYLKF
jgi:hypothetical protein